MQKSKLKKTEGGREARLPVVCIHAAIILKCRFLMGPSLAKEQPTTMTVTMTQTSALRECHYCSYPFPFVSLVF
jgi:hypothetical protein